VDISKWFFSENMPKRWRVVLTLAAMYIPYCWLCIPAEGWNWTWILICPFLPGVAVSAIIPSLPRGPNDEVPLLITGLLLAVSLMAVVRFPKAFWATVAGLFVLSCGLSWIIYLLLKA
jgi:hypothetical protein